MPRGGETLPSDVVTVEVTGPPFIPAEAEVGTIIVLVSSYFRVL